MMKVRTPRIVRSVVSPVATMLAVSLLLLFTGCGAASMSSKPVPAAAAPTASIVATPASVTPGTSVTLNVSATNATGVTVTGSDGSSYSLPASGGSQAVSPTVTTTYSATATGTGGKAAATTTVTVTQAAPPTVSVAAAPASIVTGGSTTLTVTAANATQVTVSGSDGSSYNLQPNGGTQAIDPGATTTYTATANGPGGKASATTTVTVTPPAAPTVSIAANPATIVSGTSSALLVTAANATQVVVTGTDGSNYSLAANGGTQPVNPTATTTYSATATGAGGKASATAVITVTPPPAAPTVTLVATPASIVSGNSSTLTLIATNATQVIVAGSDGSTYNLAASGGTQVVTPNATTTYAATANGPGGKASATTIVSVTQPPAPTISIAASPTTIVSGNSSTLTVTAANATQVTVTGTDGSTYSLKPNGGTQIVSPTETTTYAATATGTGGTASASTIMTVTQPAAPTVTLAANPSSIVAGNSSSLTVTATNATQVTVTGSDGSTYALQPSGGTQAVTPKATTTYTAAVIGTGGKASAAATVTLVPQGSLKSIDHVVFMLQENHSFDNYFGMLNPYRKLNGWNTGDDGKDYEVDGIDDKLNQISNKDSEGDSFSPFKLASTCIDDASSGWAESYRSVNPTNFQTSRPVLMDGFVSATEAYTKYCAKPGACAGEFTDLTGQRAMGYYDQDFLNYYYYMASQFAVSDRWFSPISSNSIPNRIATFTGGTTQGLIFDPRLDKLSQLNIPTIFQKLDQAKVSWKIYYTVTNGLCLADDDCGVGSSQYPATTFSSLTYSYRYLYGNASHAACTGSTQPSSVVGDSSNSFCIDPNHIAPLSAYFNDLKNGTLPSFAFIEAGYGNNDEHPGSGQSILAGQAQVATVLNAFMASPVWNDSVFFFSYDEGGGPYDHVPPVPGHSNDYTDASLGSIADISSIAVNADQYGPCLPTGGTPTLHCDLHGSYPGTGAGDAPTVKGFAAQLGFRLPNMIVSPFTRRHYVSHTPMDHTAVIKFVENRFIGSSAHLTARDAAQPNLLEFFDFTKIPWAKPPTPPAPVTAQTLGHDACTPTNMGP